MYYTLHYWIICTDAFLYQLFTVWDDHLFYRQYFPLKYASIKQTSIEGRGKTYSFPFFFQVTIYLLCEINFTHPLLTMKNVYFNFNYVFYNQNQIITCLMLYLCIHLFLKGKCNVQKMHRPYSYLFFLLIFNI